ncbi:MAG: hypothetical protein M3433_00735 [Actinomycetota bacterium]|nr:hypothetical protein [Actinomycetota bacterium]
MRDDASDVSARASAQPGRRLLLLRRAPWSLSVDHRRGAQVLQDPIGPGTIRSDAATQPEENATKAQQVQQHRTTLRAVIGVRPKAPALPHGELVVEHRRQMPLGEPVLAAHPPPLHAHWDPPQAGRIRLNRLLAAWAIARLR